MLFILFLFFPVSWLEDSIQFCFLAVARTQITVPPGFSAPSRAPPPGFFSQYRQNRSVDISLGLYIYVALLCYPPAFKEYLYFARLKRNENSFFYFFLKKVPSVLYTSHSRNSFILYDANLVACFLTNKAMLLSSLFREPTP